MKALPIILIAVGGVVFVVGILGIIFYVDLVTDSPEDIKDMKQDETLTVYGEIADSPDDLDPNGWPDPVSGSPWKRYNYTFKGGGYFYSEYKLDIEVGESYVIDIQYKGVKEGQPEGPALEGKDSVSGTFLYRLPGRHHLIRSTLDPIIGLALMAARSTRPTALGHREVYGNLPLPEGNGVAQQMRVFAHMPCVAGPAGMPLSLLVHVYVVQVELSVSKFSGLIPAFDPSQGIIVAAKTKTVRLRVVRTVKCYRELATKEVDLFVGMWLMAGYTVQDLSRSVPVYTFG